MAATACTDDILTTKDFKTVYKALRDARLRWRQIGIEFEFTPSDLDEIEHQYNRDHDRCLQKVIEQWLRKESLRPTWRSLVAALRESTVGEEGVAADIEKQYVLSRQSTNKLKEASTHTCKSTREPVSDLRPGSMDAGHRFQCPLRREPPPSMVLPLSPSLKPSVQNWLSKRKRTIHTLNQLASDIQAQQAARSNVTEGVSKFFEGWAQGFFAPRDAGEDVKSNAHATALNGLMTVAASGTAARAQVNLDEIQQVIDEDIQESKDVNRKLLSLGRVKVVDESELTLDVRYYLPGPEQLLMLARRLHYGKSKLAMEQLLSELQ